MSGGRAWPQAGPGDEQGQGTVEFALWRSFEGGLFVGHALMAASHHVQGAALGAVADVFLY